MSKPDLATMSRYGLIGLVELIAGECNRAEDETCRLQSRVVILEAQLSARTIRSETQLANMT